MQNTVLQFGPSMVTSAVYICCNYACLSCHIETSHKLELEMFSVLECITKVQFFFLEFLTFSQAKCHLCEMKRSTLFGFDGNDLQKLSYTCSAEKLIVE